MRPSIVQLTDAMYLSLDGLKGLLDLIPDAPFFVKDVDLKYICGNEAMLRLCGVEDYSDFVGRSARDFFPESASRAYEALDRKVMRTRTPMFDQIHLSVRSAGPPVWLLFGRWPVVREGSQVEGVAAIARTLPSHPVLAAKYERLANAVEFIQSSYHQDLDVKALAQHSGLSVHQVNRDFHKLLGLTPGRYLQTVRIEAAVRQLRAGVDIAETALACGYSDQSAFSRAFRGFAGMSPGEFRRKSCNLEVKKPARRPR